MLEKRGKLFFFKVVLVSFVLFIILMNFSSALSVVPASTHINFQPNIKQTIDYSVSGTKEGKTYSLYLEGDLAKYANLSKKEIKGDDSFRVFLNLPASLETPGRNVLYVGVKESIDEELLKETVGTAIEIKVLVAVYVPYPGKYVEVSFNAENSNVGEPLYFKIDATNRGKENVTIYPRIDVFSQNEEKMETLYLEERLLQTTQKISLRKFLNTSNYNPGRYKGIATIDYGGTSPSIAETSFRIGDLMIEVKNHTQRIVLNGKIQKFNIDVESGWNDNIDGVYAKVSFLNETSEILFFETSSTNLKPWETKTIMGYFDDSYFKEGNYNANITLFYYGKDIGKSSNKMVQVEFVKKEYPLLMISLISLGVLVIIGLIVFFLRRKKSNKKVIKKK